MLGLIQECAQELEGSTPYRKCKRGSKIPHNIAQTDAEGFCYFEKGGNRDGPLGPLHLADVNRVQIGSFSQFLLAQTGFSPVSPDILADELPIFGHRWHGQPTEQ